MKSNPKEISRAAKRLFENALPRSWAVRNQEDQEDYGIDFEIEVMADSDRPTGFIFKVQVKGTESTQYIHDGATVSYSGIPTTKIAYYLNDVRIPVFFIVIDVAVQCVVWVELQGNQTVKNALSAATESGHETLTLHLPVANRLPGTESRLLVAAARCLDSIAASHPNVVQLGLKSERERLEVLDSRIRIRVSADEDHTKFTILPKEDVDVKFTFPKLSKDGLHIREAMARGTRFDFEPGTCSASGSGLIEHLAAQATSVQFSRSIKVIVDLVALDANGTEVSRLKHLRGALQGGSRDARLEVALESVLRLSSGWINVSKGGTGAVPVTLTLSLESWQNRPIMSVRHLESLAAFFDFIPSCRTVRVECWRDGKVIYSPTWSGDAIPKLRAFRYPLRMLSIAKRLAAAFGVDPRVPKDITESHWKGIEYLAWLYSDEELESPQPDIRVKTVIPGEEVPRFLAGYRSRGSKKSVLSGLITEPEQIPLLTEKIDVGRIQREITDVALSTPLKKIERCAQRGDEEVVLHWTGTPTTKVRVKKLDLVMPMLVSFGPGDVMALNASGRMQRAAEHYQASHHDDESPPVVDEE